MCVWDISIICPIDHIHVFFFALSLSLSFSLHIAIRSPCPSIGSPSLEIAMSIKTINYLVQGKTGTKFFTQKKRRQKPLIHGYLPSTTGISHRNLPFFMTISDEFIPQQAPSRAPSRASRSRAQKPPCCDGRVADSHPSPVVPDLDRNDHGAINFEIKVIYDRNISKLVGPGKLLLESRAVQE